MALSASVTLLRTGDSAALREKALVIPESRLRQWSILSAEAGAAEFFRVIERADANFRFATAGFNALIHSLRRWIVLGILVSFIWVIDGASHLSHGMQAEKTMAAAVIAGDCAEMFDGLSRVLLVIGVTYLVRWYMSIRLERRVRAWEHFRDSARALRS